MNAYTGGAAKSNDESTWSDFETAVASVEELAMDGIGFFFKTPYFGIDIDDVRTEIDRFKNDDHDNNIVSEFINVMCSYAEISPSGNGIHVIAKGILPEGGRRKGKVEMYDSGRFFTITNDHLGGYSHIADDTDYGKINYLHSKYIAKQDIARKQTAQSQQSGSDLSEDEIIHIATGSKNGARFNILLSGGWEQFYTSQSEADMAFANDLAFWTNRDFHKMDSIFRTSALYREKWDRPQNDSTYGAETLNRAIADCANVFSPKPREDDFNLYVLDDSIQKIQRKFYSYDDTGNAQRFRDAYGEVVRFSYVRKEWYFYDGKIWTVDQEGKIKSLADEAVEKMKDEPVYVPKDADPEVMEKAFSKHVKATRSSRGKVSMLKETEHLLPIKPDAFDSDKKLFNVQNGYLDLSTGVLMPHDKDKFFTKASNVEYTDKIDCPMWLDFLDVIFQGDQDLIDYMQRAVGYSLSGSTEEQVMFVLFGNGRNGKSVFLDIITEMFGNYSTNIQPQTIMVKQQSGGANSDIARLDGARLVTTTEPNEGSRLDEGLVKQLTGGDKVTARFLYGTEFDFEPELKLWMATNHKPVIRGTDDGIWRRMAIIPFNAQIPIEKVDKQLKNKLKGELKAILNWAVEGYQLWKLRGLAEPTVIAEQRRSYQTEMDSVEAFIEECCIREEGHSVQSKIIYQAYRQWANDNGQYLMSNTKFGREMGNKFNKVKSNGVIKYDGVHIMEEYSNSEYRISY